MDNKILTGTKVDNAGSYNVKYEDSDINDVFIIKNIPQPIQDKFYFDLINTKIHAISSITKEDNDYEPNNEQGSFSISDLFIPDTNYTISCQAVPAQNDTVWTESEWQILIPKIEVPSLALKVTFVGNSEDFDKNQVQINFKYDDEESFTIYERSTLIYEDSVSQKKKITFKIQYNGAEAPLICNEEDALLEYNGQSAYVVSFPFYGKIDGEIEYQVTFNIPETSA